MFRVVRTIIITSLAITFSVTVVLSETVEALSVPSDSKYVARMQRKQALLLEMNQETDVLKKAMGIPLDFDKKETLETIANGKYIDRLGHKLEAVIKDAIKDIDTMQSWTPQPLMNGTCPPESRFDLEDIESKIEEGKK